MSVEEAGSKRFRVETETARKRSQPNTKRPTYAADRSDGVGGLGGLTHSLSRLSEEREWGARCLVGLDEADDALDLVANAVDVEVTLTGVELERGGIDLSHATAGEDEASEGQGDEQGSSDLLHSCLQCVVCLTVDSVARPGPPPKCRELWNRSPKVCSFGLFGRAKPLGADFVRRRGQARRELAPQGAS